MTIEQMETKLNTWTEEAVKNWFEQQLHDMYGAYYLYYKPMNESIIIAKDAPAGYELANGERISPAWTQEKACYQVRRMLNRLPLFT